VLPFGRSKGPFTVHLTLSLPEEQESEQTKESEATEEESKSEPE
jgi:hypothetical protein